MTLISAKSHEYRSLIEHFRMILKDGPIEEKLFGLEFLSLQTTIPRTEAEKIFPILQDILVDQDPQARYLARKARNQLLALYGTLENTAAEALPENGDFEKLSPRDILLKKLHLKSRYLVFEAIERLTESRDPALAEPLLNFLAKESDPFKLSFLVKRITRIPDPRIPPTVGVFLDHPDQRIVANAIEGLCEINIPELKQRFAELALSPDNRIRANAVRALHRYDSERAEEHLKLMVESPSIAIQDSAVYLIGILKPKNLNKFIEVASMSKFATIRLKALEIPKNPSRIANSSVILSAETLENKEFFGLVASLTLAVAIIILAQFLPKTFLITIFLVAATITALAFPGKREYATRLCISGGLIACLAWGDNRFLALLGLMTVWFPKTSRSPVDSHFLPRVVALSFAACAIILSQIQQGQTGKILEVGYSMLDGQKIASNVSDILIRHRRFVDIQFAIICLYTIFLIHFNRWFKTNIAGKSPDRKLLWAYAGGLFIVILLNLSHSMGIKFALITNGFHTPASILTFLGK